MADADPCCRRDRTDGRTALKSTKKLTKRYIIEMRLRIQKETINNSLFSFVSNTQQILLIIIYRVFIENCVFSHFTATHPLHVEEQLSLARDPSVQSL